MNIWLYWELLKNSIIDNELMKPMNIVEVQELLKGVNCEDGGGCGNDGDSVQLISAS